MSRIHQDHLIDSVADALQFISYYHPKDFVDAVHAAYEREESKPAKDAMAQILINSRLCAEGHRPICQDTGIVTVFLKVGMNVEWEGATMSPTDMINEGVRRAYLHPDNKLRASILADPAHRRLGGQNGTDDGCRLVPTGNARYRCRRHRRKVRSPCKAGFNGSC